MCPADRLDKKQLLWALLCNRAGTKDTIQNSRPQSASRMSNRSQQRHTRTRLIQPTILKHLLKRLQLLLRYGIRVLGRRIRTAPDLIPVRLQGPQAFRPHITIPLHKRGQEPPRRGVSQHVDLHQHLAGAPVPGADADGRDGQPPSSLMPCTRPVLTMRMAVSRACSGLISYDPIGRSPTWVLCVNEAGFGYRWAVG